jgi:hypothetical protein
VAIATSVKEKSNRGVEFRAGVRESPPAVRSRTTSRSSPHSSGTSIHPPVSPTLSQGKFDGDRRSAAADHDIGEVSGERSIVADGDCSQVRQRVLIDGRAAISCARVWVSLSFDSR